MTESSQDSSSLTNGTISHQLEGDEYSYILRFFRNPLVKNHVDKTWCDINKFMATHAVGIRLVDDDVTTAQSKYTLRFAFRLKVMEI